jgi:hypothetical protein
MDKHGNLGDGGSFSFTHMKVTPTNHQAWVPRRRRPELFQGLLRSQVRQMRGAAKPWSLGSVKELTLNRSVGSFFSDVEMMFG